MANTKPGLHDLPISQEALLPTHSILSGPQVMTALFEVGPLSIRGSPTQRAEQVRRATQMFGKLNGILPGSEEKAEPEVSREQAGRL